MKVDGCTGPGCALGAWCGLSSHLQHYIFPPCASCGIVAPPYLLVLPLVLDIPPIITSFIITCPLPPHTSPHKGLFTLTLLLRVGLEDPLGAWDQLML